MRPRALNRKVLTITLICVPLLAAAIFGLNRYQLSRHGEFYVARGIDAKQAGEIREAITFFRQALELEPGRTDILDELADALESAGDARGAYLTSQQLERLTADDPRNLLRIARLALPMQRYGDAVDRLRSLLGDQSIDSAVVEKTELLSLLGQRILEIVTLKQPQIPFAKQSNSRTRSPKLTRGWPMY